MAFPLFSACTLVTPVISNPIIISQHEHTRNPLILTVVYPHTVCVYREKVQFIRSEGVNGLARLSSDADLVMLLR